MGLLLGGALQVEPDAIITAIASERKAAQCHNESTVIKDHVVVNVGEGSRRGGVGYPAVVEAGAAPVTAVVPVPAILAQFVAVVVPIVEVSLLVAFLATL